VAGVVAAMTRADSGVLSPVPSAVAGIVAALAVSWLVRRRPALRPRDPASGGPAFAEAPPVDEAPRPDVAPDPDRRRFLLYSGGATLLGALAIAGGVAVHAGTRATAAARALLRLPRAAVTAPPIPAGAELSIPGLAPLVTPNVDFYRIDTALQVPVIDHTQWSLRVTGMVDAPFELTWDELVALPLEESITTLTCVSNEVGGGLIGNAVWLGYPLREVLRRARPQADADMVLSRSSDGFTASTPIEALTDDREAILAIGMNGAPLPLEHGFPVRMVVPGLYGYVSATKWVVELEVTRFDRETAYWTDRGWGERGPIKISSRIDVPAGGLGRAQLDAGDTVIAGVAWHQHTGIDRVEVRIDDGEWQQAELADAISIDTWRQWRLDWRAEPGTHRLTVRAIGADGEVQTSETADVVPDGATGLHSVTVDVGD